MSKTPASTKAQKITAFLQKTMQSTAKANKNPRIQVQRG